MSSDIEKQTRCQVEFGQIREPIEPSIDQLVFTPSPAETQTLFDSEQIPTQFLGHKIDYKKPVIVYDSAKDLPEQLNLNRLGEEYPDEDHVFQGTLDFSENGADFRSANVHNTRRNERLRKRLFRSSVV